MNLTMKEKLASLSEEKRRQLIELTAAAADVPAALESLKAAGFEVDEAAVNALFKQVNTPPEGELSDGELENVAGGCGCGDCVDCSQKAPDKPM